MRVTWITDDDTLAMIEYGTASGQYPFPMTGNTMTCSYVMNHSGNIHDAVVGPLKPSMTYYYRCSSDTSREFSFRTPPSGLPFSFVITDFNSLVVSSLAMTGLGYGSSLDFGSLIVAPSNLY